ncbi:MAG TPA: hypothetical protein PKO41_00660 [Dokdonella sp.]|uniref:hypothetical protein n=1 Tax=Dokdonella sp. TaxID=2291710 RepID=UPI0025C17297|nr:hypothetical protein [Dokdonella sp.]MBX3692231.1 hypothetical protein [Dokdonella sp.]HNR90910.1 hypothetical protein [Dokdonella sp.]
MLDDYSLRLLAEMGVEVYLPRASSAATIVDAAPPSGAPTANTAGVVFVCPRDAGGRLRSHVLLALRAAGLRVLDGEDVDLVGDRSVAAVVVLGEACARALGAGLPAPRHAELEWVISGEPAALARGAAPKRALWGEIKRLARTLVARR